MSGLNPNIQFGVGSHGIGNYGKWKTGYDGGTGLACDKLSCSVGTDFTLIAVFDGSTTGSVLSPIIGGDETGNRQFQFRLTASNTVEFIRFNTAGTNYSTSVAASSRRGVFVARSSGTTFHVWANGVKSSAGSIAAGSPQPVTKVALNGKFSFDTTPQIGDAIFFAAVLPGALSDEHIARLTENPYLIIKPAAETIPLPTAAGGSDRTGTLSATQAGDTLTGSGQLALAATLSATQASNALTGQAALALAGTLSATQASDSLAASGTVGSSPIAGTLSATQASNSITAQGALAIGATLSATQAGNTITANGSSTHSGDLSVTQDSNTLTGAGALSLSGYLSATQSGDTLSASAVLAIVGSMSATQAADTLAATGARDLFATLSAVQASQTLTASGTSAAGMTDSEKIDLILDILMNRQELTTGLYTLYADDATTVLYTAAAWEDAAATIPYRGQGLARLDAMQ